MLVITGLAVGFGCGCASPSGEPPPSYMTEAVLRSFNDISEASWSGVKIYIEPSAYVPADLKKIGATDAEVMDSRKLRKRYEFTETAPAMAIVDAYKDDDLIHVEIEYFPLRMKEWQQPAIGRGMFEYVYKPAGGKLILLRRTNCKL